VIAAATLAQWDDSNVHPLPTSCSPCDLLNSSMVTVTINDADSEKDSWVDGDSFESSEEELGEEKSPLESAAKCPQPAQGSKGDGKMAAMGSSSCDANGVYIILQVDSEDEEDDDEFRYSSSGEAMRGDGRL